MEKDLKSDINIGQIGVGYWGPNLLRNLIENKNCVVENVIDISKQRREFLKNSHNELNVSDNINDVIMNENIDAVVISTPVSTHYDLAMKCLENGKHILVEKPMAMKSDEIDQIEILS